MTPSRPPDIRQLTAADIGLLRQLNAVFAESFEDDATYRAAPPDEAYLQRVLAGNQVIVLVAVDGTAVVGGLVAYQLDKLERSRSEIYLYDLAVAPARRRRGIATRLIDRLRFIAGQRGAWVVFVQADRGDDPAIALYSRLGRREDVLHFDLPLPGNGGAGPAGAKT